MIGNYILAIEGTVYLLQALVKIGKWDHSQTKMTTTRILNGHLCRMTYLRALSTWLLIVMNIAQSTT